MAGVYVHIPFCKTRCVYCGFFSTTLRGVGTRYVDAVLREFRLRRDYLRGEPVETVYVGGGTPSRLPIADLRRLLNGLGLPPASPGLHSVKAGARGRMEVTVECNPDDVTAELVSALVASGVNRVSMGAQTFSDERLRFLRRRHTAAHVREAVGVLRRAGIRNVSLDIMFGFPEETLDEWLADVDSAVELGPEHISAYSLMYEEGTPLMRLLESGAVREADEALSREMYYALKDRLEAAGYEHYEISNFARPGFRSRHNSGYWRGTAYIGLGAGAHSYDGNSRQWNAEDVMSYINKVEEGSVPFEREQLDATTRYNDMIATALRTADGIDLDRDFPHRGYFLREAKPLMASGLLEMRGNRVRLTRDALYVSDSVMRQLVFVG